MSSMGALVSSFASIPLAWGLGYPQMVLLCALLAQLIFWRHRGNIARIKAGTEPKIGQK
jgi:glycerol-3-phosphate acyltransferase PlsY